MNYDVVAFYKFVTIEDPAQEVERQKRFLKKIDARARIYISEEGINGQMSIQEEETSKYLDWMGQNPLFQDIDFKIQKYSEHVFPRVTVKYRKQLVAIDHEIDLSQTGEHVTPQQWKSMLESDENYLVLDVRNDYEWEIGHFEGAKKPNCNTFREFPEYADKLTDEYDPKNTKVMMFCTGGIRCEPFSALLKQKGFEDVYQLKGGVIKYAEQEGAKHWRGNLFVFDDRLSIPLDQEGEAIGTCHHCQGPANHHYNCANLECDLLFLSCEECVKKFKRCCQKSCMEAKAVRPMQDTKKPFKRWYNYFESKEKMWKDD